MSAMLCLRKGTRMRTENKKKAGCYKVITSLISNINKTLDTLIYEPALMSLVNILKICLISISNQQHSTKKEYTIKEKYD